MQNNTDTPHGTALEVFAKVTNTLVLIALGGLIFAVAASAQSPQAFLPRTGSISGTVADSNDDLIPNATIVLQGTGSDHLTATTKDDGSFALRDVTPGTYEITVTAEGFAGWSSPLTLDPGQDKTLADIKLHILAAERAVTVSYSSKEVATAQVKSEERQRILGFIPNLYVTYEPHPEPLTTRMKFELAYKGLTHPMFFARVAGWAAVQQATNTPHYGQGAEGYGKRLGAGFADGVSEGLIGNAILPSLLHQDPRYFYRTGTKKSRASYAMLAPFICKGDNGTWQPNYSTWGGSLIASSISMAYYPSSDRSAEHVFKNFGIGMGLHVASSLAQEFILDKFTKRGKH